MEDKILEIKDLSVDYGRYNVLKDVSFSVDRGDYLGILGPNGAGKSTLIKAILDLLDHKGEKNFFIDRSRVGYLPQLRESANKLFPATVGEVVATGLIGKKSFPRYMGAEDKKKVEELLDRLAIGHLKNKRIGDLSGGQSQRVLLCRALVGEPELLILDEPTSALDPNVRDSFYKLLQELNKVNNLTIIFISHDIATIGKYASKMLYLDKELVFYGNNEDFCKSSKMTEYFGHLSQHQICWRHNHEHN